MRMSIVFCTDIYFTKTTVSNKSTLTKALYGSCWCSRKASPRYTTVAYSYFELKLLKKMSEQEYSDLPLFPESRK